jgi:hypothetical protein
MLMKLQLQTTVSAEISKPSLFLNTTEKQQQPLLMLLPLLEKFGSAVVSEKDNQY